MPSNFFKKKKPDWGAQFCFKSSDDFVVVVGKPV